MAVRKGCGLFLTHRQFWLPSRLKTAQGSRPVTMLFPGWAVPYPGRPGPGNRERTRRLISCHLAFDIQSHATMPVLGCFEPALTCLLATPQIRGC